LLPKIQDPRMTEIHRVPLQPIAKGALTKLWLALIAVVLVGGLLAWRALPSHVKVTTIAAGTGASPTEQDVALVNYIGRLPDGKVFDEGKQAVFPLQGVIPGFTQALMQMQKGGRYKVHIPWQLAYGAKGAGPIPPKTDLDFDVDLIDFRSRAEIEQQQRMMQQLQQQMQGKGGAPGAEAPQGAPEAGPAPN
jgi:FKBP-type peptidyl-prolyl cis-trans isomerase FkpA